MLSVRDLIGQVAARNQVRVDEDDLIFAVSTINRLMLEEAVEQIASRFGTIVEDFEKHAEIVDERAGQLFAAEVRRTAMAWRDQINDDIKAAGIKGEKIVAAAARSYTWAQMVVWGIVGLTFGAILSRLALLSAGS